MQVFIIIALLIAILAVIFALQNTVMVSITFLAWNIHGSLALVLLVTLAAGVVISLLASLPSLVRSRLTSRRQKKKLAALEAERNLYQQKAEEAGRDVPSLEEQVASLSAEYEDRQSGETLKEQV